MVSWGPDPPCFSQAGGISASGAARRTDEASGISCLQMGPSPHWGLLSGVFAVFFWPQLIAWALRVVVNCGLPWSVSHALQPKHSRSSMHREQEPWPRPQMIRNMGLGPNG